MLTLTFQIFLLSLFSAGREKRRIIVVVYKFANFNCYFFPSINLPDPINYFFSSRIYDDNKPSVMGFLMIIPIPPCLYYFILRKQGFFNGHYFFPMSTRKPSVMGFYNDHSSFPLVLYQTKGNDLF